MIDCTQSCLDHLISPPHLVRVSSKRLQAAGQPPAPPLSLRGGSSPSAVRVYAAPSAGDIPPVRSEHLFPSHLPPAVPYARHADKVHPLCSFPKDTKSVPLFSQCAHCLQLQPLNAINLPSVDVNARKCSERVWQPKTSATVSVLHVFSWRSVDVSRRFDPVDSTESFRRATSHCTEFAVDRFATLDCSGTLIRAAATCQKFALHCVGSPATFPEPKDRHRDSNTPLNPLSDRHDSAISDSDIQPEICMISLKSR